MSSRANAAYLGTVARRIVHVGVALTVTAWVAPAAAHHAFASVFDVSMPMEFTGEVTKVEWMNPHVWIYVDVPTQGGPTENWGFEMGSVNHLVRLGWHRDALRPGAVVTVSGVRARDESLRVAAVRSVTLSTGEELFGGQNESP